MLVESRASTGRDRLLALWDVGNAKELQKLEIPGPTLFNPNETVIGVHSENQVRFFEVATLKPIGSEIELPPAQRSSKPTLSISPDGTRFVAVMREAMHAWNVLSGESVGSCSLSSGQHAMLRTVVWSDDVPQVAVFSQSDPTLTHWNLASGNSQEYPVASAENAALSRDGQFLAIVSRQTQQRVIDLHDTSTGDRLVDSISRPSDSPKPDVAVVKAAKDRYLRLTVTNAKLTLDSRDGERLLSASVSLYPAGDESKDYRIDSGLLKDLNTGQRVAQYLGPSDGKFHPAGDSFFTRTNQGQILRWRVPQKSYDYRLISKSRTTVVSEDASRAVTFETREGNAIQLWNVETSERIGPVLEFEFARSAPGRAFPLSVAISPNGETVATSFMAARGAPNIAVWNARTGARVAELSGPRGMARGLRFSPDGREIVAFQSDLLYRWDTQSWKPLSEPMDANYGNPVGDVLFDPAGRTILATHGNAQQIWSRITGKPLGPMLNEGKRLEQFGSRSPIFYSPDGSIVVTNVISEQRLYDATTGDVLRIADDTVYPEWNSMARGGGDLPGKSKRRLWFPELHEPVPFAVLAFSPKGDVFAASMGLRGSKQIQIRDLRSGKRIGEPLLHAGSIRGAEFSADGRWLASWGDSLRIWDLTSRKPVPTSLTASRPPGIATFSRDGRFVATTSRLHHTETGIPVGGHRDVNERGPRSVQFTSDDRGIFVYPQFGIYRIFAPETGMVEEVTSRLERLVLKRLDDSNAVWPVTAKEWSQEASAR